MPTARWTDYNSCVPQYELLGGNDDETRMLREGTTGYSLVIPGRPLVATAAERGPRYDVTVALRDLPATLGFRIDDLPTSLEPKALAAALATAYASSRAEKPPRVRPIGTHMRPPSTLAGADAVYAVRDAAEPTMEQVWLLLHGSPRGVWALYFTTSFRSADVNTFQWGHLRAAMIDQHGWDSVRPRGGPLAMWPASEITKPSAKLDLTDDAWKIAEWKAQNVGSLTPDVVIELGDLLRDEVQSDLSPRAELVETRADTIRGHIRRGVPPSAAEALLRDLDRCRTMHDLRGWAWQCAWAIGNRAELRHARPV
jgi:hypothetical protein